ncbi:SURF1 family cytochrome oxidase biogenesis protein [Rickettsia endosymbiont of Cardiosporidium cionae]|uniref:SURF1 family cytochrome oxidase biogenesis protein n=1 Tax=Rickettsia endosymbiont of Cardiosporidium cionae TaxID=2777155 RepID=UPI0018951F54|nr:SURF1 family cytochrome oxidase biogenesis protein [Rickettsia endosymbiont of Cardiosporidium cionae]KAF8818880.1 hypothetical protein IHI24_000114 [Rickettsia endosymbiont of Cardiosporidium cionae]
MKHIKNIFLYLSYMLSITLMILIGFIQQDKFYRKTSYINALQNKVGLYPIDVNSIENFNKIEKYSKIKLKGFFTNNNIFVYGQRSIYREKHGYYLLSEFKTDINKTFAVLRGWIPYNIKKSIDLNALSYNDEIVVFAFDGEKSSVFLPKNDLKNNIWFALDLEQISSVFNLDINKYLFVAVDSKMLPSYIKKLNIDNIINKKNDHMLYAIMWYIFAVIATIIFIIKSKIFNSIRNKT